MVRDKPIGRLRNFRALGDGPDGKRHSQLLITHHGGRLTNIHLLQPVQLHTQLHGIGRRITDSTHADGNTVWHIIHSDARNDRNHLLARQRSDLERNKPARRLGNQRKMGHKPNHRGNRLGFFAHNSRRNSNIHIL
jgi:hypothetical protein